MVNTYTLSRSKYLGLVLCIMAWSGCGSANIMCPDEVDILEPILSVAVADSAEPTTGPSVFYISKIHIEDRSVPVDMLHYLSLVNATVVGDSVICSGQCSFGTTSGNYRFIVSTPNYVSKSIEVEAKYSEMKKNGCKTQLSGGAKITVLLSRVLSD